MKQFLCSMLAVGFFSTTVLAAVQTTTFVGLGSDISLGAPLVLSAVQTTTFDGSKLPKGVKFEGKLTSGLRWTDKSGDNFVIFSRVEKPGKDGTQSVYIYATHYVVNGGTAKNLRVVKDLTENCDADIFTEFRQDSFSVTDLDIDDIGEVSFTYTVGCVSDVSPITLKLLVLEGGEKFIIRGETLVEVDGEKVGGKKEVDAAFKKAPKTFLDFAEKKWTAQVAGK